MAPFDIVAILGKLGGYLVFLLIGMGFGSVLEMSGFGDSRKLSAQFYLKDMTVLKVMFTAIIVAMVLIFGFAALGWLDFNRVFVNPTYLTPGIVGGLIMGVGFIVGGFCPGTSIVALATLKLDGLFFVLGVVFGVYLFGETVSLLGAFADSTYLGRFILPELFGLSTGIVVFLVILMALAMFYGAELSERFFGQGQAWRAMPKLPVNRHKMIASGVLVFAAIGIMLIGQPSAEDRWNWIKEAETQKLDRREVYVHPGELLEVMNDTTLYCELLDMRSESDFNLFHLEHAKRLTTGDLRDVKQLKRLRNLPSNTVVVVVSNTEIAATQAYRLLVAQGILNLYILDGGINHWLAVFPVSSDIAVARPQTVAKADDELQYRFARAVGATNSVSNPGLTAKKNLELKKIEYTRKVKMQKSKSLSGGCG